MKLNTLIVGDTEYTLSKAYRDGALAMRQRIPFTGNPFKDPDCQSYSDWDEGHTNESAGEHIRFGIDVITAPATGECFKLDPYAPYDEYGVKYDWYQAKLAEIQQSKGEVMTPEKLWNLLWERDGIRAMNHWLEPHVKQDGGMVVVIPYKGGPEYYFTEDSVTSMLAFDDRIEVTDAQGFRCTFTFQ